MSLFPKEHLVGIFRGFSEGGLEFHADLVLPYKTLFQSSPMHGQFLLVQLENQSEGVLGRITAMSSDGRLTFGTGEDYGLRAIAEDREIPEDLLDQYLKYRVNIRVLGVLREVNGSVVFAASHRRLPHLGSKVAFLSPQLLREVAGHNIPGAELGFLALGEFVYGEGDHRLKKEPWMQAKSPAVIPRFQIQQLVSRRSFIFARAGFGKSNLNKLLFSSLYKETPTVTKRGGRQVPVGTIIFDPDGEYFWPDDKHRPGLCDVPHLQDRLVVFTNRQGPSAFYQSFVAGGIKLDIRRLRPADVISIALSPEKQDQQNVRKLKGLNSSDWSVLVAAVAKDGNSTDPATICRLLKLEDHQEAEMAAARANMTQIVKQLHDQSSQMLDMLVMALRQGKLCVVDVSQMRGSGALMLSGLILHHIFDRNQQEFTKAEPETIPTVAVIEEAQSVLGHGGSSGEGPYVAWVKEGRKYDLGAVMITQQPGSISAEILSQGDNWFVFHLLSSVDLTALKKANSHFSDDLLSSLLNEPIPGHCVFWSSTAGKAYPIPVRIFSFEEMYQVLDPDGRRAPVQTYAEVLRQDFIAQVEASQQVAGAALGGVADAEFGEMETPDVLGLYLQAAFSKVLADERFMRDLREKGKPWMGVTKAIAQHLPETMADREDVAYRNVQRFMESAFGQQGWQREKRTKVGGSGTTTYVIARNVKADSSH